MGVMLIKQIRQTCTIGLHHHTTLPAELMTIKAKLHKNRDRKREAEADRKTITTTTKWPLLLEKVKRERKKTIHYGMKTKKHILKSLIQ